MSDVAVLNGRAVSDPIELLDGLVIDPAVEDIRGEVLAGLSQRQKSLPCKLFYDDRGSRLFDRICELPEYYPTRTELQIMRDHADAMVARMGTHPLIVEFGSGSSLKTRLLLDRMPHATGYIPIDISSEHLGRAAESLAVSYSHIPIMPLCADYTRPFALPTLPADPGERIVAYFPGSTIGNFELEEAKAFLVLLRRTCGRGSGLLIGVDLKKDPAILHAAYNDAAGTTAAFNLNLLHRLNRDLGTTFDIAGFSHYACYSPARGRVEMHLVSRTAQTVHVPGSTDVTFAEGESIHTESCHKYTIPAFIELAGEAGYRFVDAWTDERSWFSVQYFLAQ